jgi:hypothetical protein
MSRLTLARTLILAGLAATAAALAGCGKTGALERPAPLFGKPLGPPAAQNPSTYDPSRPINTIDPRDEAIDPGLSPTGPAQGNSADSTASGSPTNPSNPYAAPTP